MDHDIRHLTIGEVLAERAAALGDKTYLTFLPTGRAYSYRDVDLISNRWANALAARGIGRGDKVAVMLENCPEQLIVYFALGKIGAVAVPINCAARGDQLAHFLQFSDAVLIVAAVQFLERIAAVRRKAPLLSSVLVFHDPREIEPRASMPADAEDFRVLADAPDTPPAVKADFRDPAFIAFTSGTTGPSKGIVISQAAMLLGALNYARSYGYGPDDVYYVCLPLFHTSAVRAGAYLSLMGAGSVALTDRFSVSRFWQEVRDSGATTFNLLGSMTNFLWNAPASPRDRQHNVRFCRMAPVPHFAAGFEERFNLRVVSAYGLTDVGIPVAFTLEHPRSKLGSCGRPRQGWQVAIVDEDDFLLPAGEAGEIVIRCDVPWHASSGYYKMPEETLKMIRNGWYHTGDRGFLDEDGFLFFADRKKDSLRRRGENISAWEVEQIILRHPDVEDAAVYALAAEESEDEVAVSIVLAAQSNLSEEDVIRYCADNMAYYMVPRFVHFTDKLPVTPNHKVRKEDLRRWAAENIAMMWDCKQHGIVVSK